MAYYADIRRRDTGTSLAISRAGVEVGNATFGYAPAAIGAVAGLAGASGANAALVSVLAVPIGITITTALEGDSLDALERMSEHPFMAIGAAAATFFAGWYVAKKVSGG